MSNQVYQNQQEKYYHQPGNNYYQPSAAETTITSGASVFVPLSEGLIKVSGIATPETTGLRILQSGHYTLSVMLRLDPVSGQSAVQPEVVVQLESSYTGTGNIAKLKTNVENIQATTEPGNPKYIVVPLFAGFYAYAGDFIYVKVTNRDYTLNSTIKIVGGGSALVLSSAY